MKTYNVIVNGKAYTVSVEEVNGAAPAAVSAPAAAPAGEAKVTVTAPMPGTIVAVNVTVGQKVEKGTVLCLLEAMKMENEIMAPEGGTVTGVATSKGASVNAGDILITIA